MIMMCILKRENFNNKGFGPFLYLRRLMNIYMVINLLNWKNNIKPCLYIGSDTKDREDYMGSSKSLKIDIKEHGLENFAKNYLWKGDTAALNLLGYNSLLEIERSFHLKFDVVKSVEFYNKVNAGKEFSTKGTANYYYINDSNKKIFNLPINHPDVLNKSVVGMNKGNKFKVSEESEIARKATCMRKYGVEHPNQLLEFSIKLRKPKSEETKARMRKPKSEGAKKNMRAPKSENFKFIMRTENPNQRGVSQFTLNNEFIDSFDSIKNAAISVYPDIKRWTSNKYIRYSCQNKIENYEGYIWRYKPEDVIETTGTDIGT
jgi:hypothetical protein